MDSKQTRSNFQEFTEFRRAKKEVERRSTSSFIKVNIEVRKDKNMIYKYAANIALNQYFTMFISLIIILNTIVLSLDRYPQSAYEDAILEKINIAFFVIFTIEMLIKIAGFGIKTYVKSTMNIFDGTVVLISMIDVILYSLLN